MTELIETIFSTCRVQDERGKDYELQGGVDRTRGHFLANLVKHDASIVKTLEVGCAHGISSLHICSSLAGRTGAKHIIIDPFEYKDWHGIGIANLKRAGYTFYELIEERSEFALPRLVQEAEGTFDLVFVDGWHTFDHTLLDMFYASKLLRVGGYIVVDDCDFVAISKAISYMSQYPCHRFHSQAVVIDPTLKRKAARLLRNMLPDSLWSNVLPKAMFDAYQRVKYTSIVAIQKVSVDERPWNWYAHF
ncbi:MAG: class I SAM-dependent methyltransferase [Ignavibacteria bacterium]|nr:class I SAM-dependent methyltransferase [Ignavibacteria bacterium]